MTFVILDSSDLRPTTHHEARWRRCPQHGPTCPGATCCCLQQHKSPLPPPVPTQTTAEVMRKVAHKIEGHTMICNEGTAGGACDPCVKWNGAIQLAIDYLRSYE